MIYEFIDLIKHVRSEAGGQKFGSNKATSTLIHLQKVTSCNMYAVRVVPNV